MLFVSVFSIHSNADKTSQTNSAWSNIKMVVKETNIENGNKKELTWEYYRNSEGHWKKILTDMQDPKSSDELGYVLQFNGEEVVEFIPKYDTLLVSKVNSGDQYEADFFIQPQRTYKLNQLAKKFPVKDIQLNNKPVKQIEIINEKNKEKYLFDKDFVFEAEIDNQEVQKKFEVLSIEKVNKKELSKILNSNPEAEKIEYLN